MQTYEESEFATMDPAARIRWLGAQCGEFERQLHGAVAPDLVPRFRSELDMLAVAWEREHGHTGEKVDCVAEVKKLRDWAASNGKPVSIIDEFLATYTKFSDLLEDFQRGIFKPLKEAFPKHSCKKVRKAEKKLSTVLASWKDLLEASKSKKNDTNADRTSSEEIKKESTHSDLEGLIPALQEKAQQVLKLATKWGRLLEDDILQQGAGSSNDNLRQVSMATDREKTAKDKSDKHRGSGNSTATTSNSKGRVHSSDKSLGAPVPASAENRSVVTNKIATRSTLSEEPRTRYRKQPEITSSLATSTKTATSTTILEKKSRKEHPEIRQNRRQSTQAAGKQVTTPALLIEETTTLVVPKGKHTSKSLPSTPMELLLPASHAGTATVSHRHHRRTKSSSDQHSLHTPEENNRIGHKSAIGETTTGQAGISSVSPGGKNEPNGRVSSATYRGNAGFRKGISDLKTEFEQIRQDALMYEYNLEKERATHIKKQLTDLELRKREIKEKLQEEKTVAKFLTIGSNVDTARDKVVRLQTSLARINAKCVETEKRLQESSDRSVTLAGGIKLWSENKTSRRLEPIDRHASCKNDTGKGAREEGKALRL